MPRRLKAHRSSASVPRGEPSAHVVGRSSDSQASTCLAFSPRCSGNGNRNGQIDSAWSQRRGRPGFAPEFPVHRPPSLGQPVTSDAVRFNAPNLSDGDAGVKRTKCLSASPAACPLLGAHWHSLSRYSRLVPLLFRHLSDSEEVNRIPLPAHAPRPDRRCADGAERGRPTFKSFLRGNRA